MTITADDGNGGTAQTSFYLRVLNIVPLVDAEPGLALLEIGETFVGTGSFVDPGADVWSATVDYGERDGPQALPLNGSTFDLNNVYELAGSYSVTVSVFDGDDLGSDTVSVIVLPAPPPQGTIITVNTLDPSVNVGDGLCSLIEAIEEANVTGTHSPGDCPAGYPGSGAAGADTIVLASGAIYTLNAVNNSTVIPGYSSFGSTGLPVIATDMTILGNGAVIERDPIADNFRILFVDSASLTLDNVTVRNGVADRPDTSSLLDGGGIFNFEGDVVIQNYSFVSDNEGQFAGGIRTIAHEATLVIDSSTVSGNTSGGGGAGIYFDGSAIALINATVTQNNGEGINVDVDGDLVAIGSAITDNDGAGIHIDDYGVPQAALIKDSVITGNGGNGGIFIDGGPIAVTIENTLVAGNTGSPAGGVYLQGFVEEEPVLPNLTLIKDSVITGNTSGDGGGVTVSRGAIVTIENTLIDGNTAIGGRSGPVGRGGGVHILNQGTLFVNDSSIANNVPNGIESRDFSATEVTNSCFLNNGVGFENTQEIDGLLPQAANNWWGSSDGPSGQGPGSGDAVGVDIDFLPFLTAEPSHACNVPVAEDSTPPTVAISSITAPTDGFYPGETITVFPAPVGAQPVTVSGTSSDDVEVASVDVNGLSATVQPDGSWTVVGVPLNTGANTLTATATDSSGNEASTDVQVTLDADLDADGIHNNVDEDPPGPFEASTKFSDALLGGATSGRLLEQDPGVTAEILDEPSPDGIRVIVSGPAGSVAKVKLICSRGIYKLTPGVYVLTCNTVTLTVLQGSAEVEFIVGGAPVVVSTQETSTVVIEEIVASDEIEELNVTVIEGGATVNGATVTAGESLIILAADIDIKPGSDPNCFNNNGQGVIPVAILSSVDFDAVEVDPLTVSLDGQEVRVVGKGNTQAHAEDVNGDGLDDLTVQIEDSDGTYQEGDTFATLSGETFTGTSIQGTDAICIVR